MLKAACILPVAPARHKQLRIILNVSLAYLSLLLTWDGATKIVGKGKSSAQSTWIWRVAWNNYSPNPQDNQGPVQLLLQGGSTSRLLFVVLLCKVYDGDDVKQPPLSREAPCRLMDASSSLYPADRVSSLQRLLISAPLWFWQGLLSQEPNIFTGTLCARGHVHEFTVLCRSRHFLTCLQRVSLILHFDLLCRSVVQGLYRFFANQTAGTCSAEESKSTDGGRILPCSQTVLQWKPWLQAQVLKTLASPRTRPCYAYEPLQFQAIKLLSPAEAHKTYCKTVPFSCSQPSSGTQGFLHGWGISGCHKAGTPGSAQLDNLHSSYP